MLGKILKVQGFLCVAFATMLSILRYLKPVVEINSAAIALLKTYSDSAAIALGILLTFPVSVASAEGSFSKLQLIKTFVRSTMV